ncbi:MAG TPA: molybdopterin-dependent oxidoreductase [Microbacterium sp.]|nr:molybdopterin-dependent oxidoreductase [Microbacterium sp.]
MNVSARPGRAVAATPWAAASAGVAAAVLGAGVGESAGALLAPSSSPFAVVGGALIDAAPAWAKDTAIAWFGTSDKAALLIGIGIVLLIAAAVAGLCQARWLRSGVIAFAVIGAGVGVLALTRPEAGMLSWLPSALAGVVAAITLRLLVRKAPTPDRDDTGAPSRRQFLAWAGGSAVVGVAMAFAGTIARSGATAVASVRDAIRLPRAAKPAPALPAGASLDVPGLAPLITPNDGFYRIDTALIVPSVDPADWTLRIHGMVAQEITLTWDELRALPLVETTVTLSCVSNPVGGDLVGNAVWLGYPIRELLAKAHPAADADMVLSTSIDGFTAGTPIEALTDARDALLAIGMNGEPLPLAHGFPVRMVVPGLYGYVSATKWVTELEVTRFDRARAYWTDRGWSERGPIKLQSRIDVPRPGREIDAGDSVIAGVAWQPQTGISGVEVQVDAGPWQEAELAPAISADTWVQWRMPWQADPGEHRIRCRAISGDGNRQTDQYAAPAPNGASGWHTITVSVD